MAAGRLHGDDTTAPLLAKGKTETARLSKHTQVARAMDSMPPRWDSFADPPGLRPPSVARPAAEVLENGRIRLTNNAAVRSPRGGDRAAFFHPFIGAANLSVADPQAWLAEVLDRIADTPMSKSDELLPLNWANQKNRAVKDTSLWPSPQGRGVAVHQDANPGAQEVRSDRMKARLQRAA